MSGHSKWANIKNRKGAQDKKRSETFTKVAKNILTAIREGGGNTNPDANLYLKTAIEKSREVNMPKENIERLLAKFEERKSNLVSGIFEGFGPDAVPMIVEVETDNKNRTLSEIKNMFKVAGGNLGESGSVAYLFDRVGEIEVEGLDESKELELIDLGGVKDFGDGLILTEPDELNRVKNEVGKLGLKLVHAGIVMKIKNPVMLQSEDEVAAVLELVDSLEEHDDVVAVYTGFDYKDGT